jgi:hypothetical protein
MIEMKHKSRQIMILLIFFLLISTTGCFETMKNFDIDPVIRRANPYINKIDVNNESLQSYASNIIQNCEPIEPACILNAIYRHIVENYVYIPDPEDEEVIQSPPETIAKKGGDCEDLSILLISLLENVGITSYLVLTDTHAYALAVDINANSLWPYVEESLLAQVEKDNNEEIRQNFSDTLNLRGRSSWYYGGDGTNLSESFESMHFSYIISSTRPIDIYLVPSITEFNSFTNDTEFSHFSHCQHKQVTQVNDSCTMKAYGGIILANNGYRAASITLQFNQYFEPSFYSLFQNNSISTYTLKGKQSVVLDPTAGSYGYPGYDANVTGEKIAFDPVTKDYVYLE